MPKAGAANLLNIVQHFNFRIAEPTLRSNEYANIHGLTLDFLYSRQKGISLPFFYTSNNLRAPLDNVCHSIHQFSWGMEHRNVEALRLLGCLRGYKSKTTKIQLSDMAVVSSHRIEITDT